MGPRDRQLTSLSSFPIVPFVVINGMELLIFFTYSVLSVDPLSFYFCAEFVNSIELR